MDNIDEKLKVTIETTKDEIIKYAVGLYNANEHDDLGVDEVIKYAGDTYEHSKSVHSYLDKIGISIETFKKQYEIETPHDLAGEGNKLEWKVMYGFLNKKKNPSEKKRLLDEALKRHRIQMHHKMWNSPDSPEEWLKYGAIDAVCSLLEKRDYQNGVHYWDEILDVISSCSSEEYQKEKHKKEKMIWAVEEMQKVTPLLKDLKIMMASFLNENKKNSEENNNNSN